MPAVEAILDLGNQCRRLEIDVAQGNVDLKNLFAIAHLGRALDRNRSVEPATQPFDGLRLQTNENIAHFRGGAARSSFEMRAAQLITQVAGQHAPGREHRCVSRHDDPLDVEFARHFACVQSGRAAETQHRKAARVDTAPQRHHSDAVGHFQIDQAKDACGRLRAGDPKRCGEGVDGGLRGCRVERPGAAHERGRIEITQDHIGIGHGRSTATVAIARRPRHGAGALGPDPEDAAGIHRCDRAAAGCNARYVEAAQGNALAGQSAISRQRHGAVGD